MAQTTARLQSTEALVGLLTQSLSFDEFAREILLVFLRAVKSEAGSIFEVNHTSRALFFRAATGRSSDTVTGFTVPIGQGIAGHVVESRQMLVVSDVSESKIHLRAIQDAVGFETRNMVAIPILVRGRVFGVLEMLNRIGDHGFTEPDVEFLRQLTEVASRVIEVRLMIAWGMKDRRVERKDEAA